MSYKLYLENLENTSAFLGFNRSRSSTPFTIVGAPLDVSSSYRGGCSLAPRSIRSASRSIELCSIVNSINMESVGFEDLGDIVMAPGDLVESLKRIEDVVQNLLKENRIVFIIGGEHTVTYGGFRAFFRMFNDPCLVVFDAHLDLRDVYLGSKINHATYLRRVLEDVNLRRVLVIGARAVSLEEAVFVRKNPLVKIYRILGNKVDRSTIDSIREDLTVCKNVYLSIDMDVLDPAYAPGVQTPEPLGIDPYTLLHILKETVDSRVKVIDIVEVAPQYDLSEETSFLAARIIVEIASMILENLKGVEYGKCFENS